MPTAGGPNIAGESNLVFAYDTGDVNNSYIGEPTTNLITNNIAGDYGNAPGSSTTTLSPDGTSNATVPVPNSTSDRYQQTVAGGTYSTGTQLTYSWHYKQLSTHAGTLPNELGGLYVNALINCTLVGEKTKITDLPNGWTRWQATFQITDGSLETIIRLYFGSVIGIGGSSAAYYGHQLELKSHATPFTTGTRSVTQGLLTLVGNSTIDLSNVSFDSSAQMTFDGTDDYVNVGDTAITDFGTGDFAVECIVKIDSSIPVNNGYYKGIVVKKGAGGADAGFGIYFNTGYGKFLWSTANGSSGSERFTTNTWNSLKGIYAHVVMVRQNGATNNGHFYINGIYESIASSATVLNVNNDYNLTIGASSTLYSVYYFQGEIPAAKIYNRALTAQEVRQNYQQYKTRFNLS